MPNLTEQLSQARVAYSDAKQVYEGAIELQHRLAWLRDAMPLEGDLYKQAASTYDTVVDSVNAAWKAMRAVEELIGRLEKETQPC